MRGEIKLKSPSFQPRWFRFSYSCSFSCSCSCSGSPLRCHVSKIGALSLSVVAAILLPTMLTSCGKKTQGTKQKTAQKSEDDFLDKDAKPDERKYLLAAKPFFIAIANRKYPDAYALLSSHARARMSFNQFTPADDQAI